VVSSLNKTLIYIFCAVLLLSVYGCSGSADIQTSAPTISPSVAPTAEPTPEPTPESALEETQPVFVPAEHTLVCIGDSIASGFALPNAASQRYSALLANMLGEDWAEYNYAVPGHTGSDMLSLLNNGVASELENADIITVCIGANNVLKPAQSFLMTYSAYSLSIETGDDSALTPEDIRNAYADFRSSAQAGAKSLRSELAGALEYIHNVNTDARVILMTVYNPYKTNSTEIDIAGLPIPMNVMSDTFVNLINTVITEEAANLGYEVTDVYSAFESAEEYLINGDGAPSFIADPHPNAAGHQLIAETYYSTIAAAA